MEDIVKLDKKDRAILCELDMNARIPLSKLSKKVGMSPEVVNYRINNMIKKGVIEGFYTVVDVFKLGFIYGRIFTRLKKSGLERDKIIEYIKKLKYVGWLIHGDGKWDLAVGIYAKDLDTLQQYYYDLIFKFGDHFIDDIESIGFKIHHCKHNYLYEKKENITYTIGEKKSQISTDKTDLKILDLLAVNARIPLIDIAKKIDITNNAVKYRIKKLIKERIILCFRTKINIKKLGYIHYKVLLNLETLTQQILKNLIYFLSVSDNVIYITESFGPQDLEFEIIVKNRIELYNFMENIMVKFKNIIRDYDNYLILNEAVVNYFPLKT